MIQLLVEVCGLCSEAYDGGVTAWLHFISVRLVACTGKGSLIFHPYGELLLKIFQNEQLV